MIRWACCAGLLVLAVLSAAGCDGSDTQTAIWWLGKFNPGDGTATVVVAHGACDTYDHAEFGSSMGSAIQVTVFTKSTGTGPCTAQLESSIVTLKLPRPASQVLGGCDPTLATPTGRVCDAMRSAYTGQPIVG